MDSYLLICETIKKKRFSLKVLKIRLKRAEKKYDSLKKKYGPDVEKQSKQAVDIIKKIKYIRQKISNGS